jgi:hypothetical protein
MKFFIKLLIIPVVVMLATSCKKLVDNGDVKVSLSVEKVYSDSAATVAAVTALYGNYGNAEGFVLNSCEYGAMSADDAYFVNGAIAFDVFHTNTVTPDYSRVISYPAYRAIYAANNDLENIPGSTVISSKLKNQLIGECKFMRAYFYFYVINFYGDMPLVLTTNVAINATMARTPSAQVYQQIIADLTDAKALLTDTYPSIERTRINKKAVSAFLARVYLYTNNYAAAQSEASEVINSNTYSLEPDPNNVFLKTSKETIWQIESNYSASVKGVTPMGNAFIPASATPSVVLYDALNNAFETADKRKSSWRKAISYNSNTYYYPYKYKYRSTSTSGNEYSVMLRLAEQYLIRAEALARQGNIPAAQDDLNKVRSRAGLSNTTATDLNLMLTALEQERWVELFTENSDRWLNLKRRVVRVLTATKGGFPAYQALYPLWRTDIINNVNLTQNPGY